MQHMWSSRMYQKESLPAVSFACGPDSRMVSNQVSEYEKFAIINSKTLLPNSYAQHHLNANRISRPNLFTNGLAWYPVNICKCEYLRYIKNLYVLDKGHLIEISTTLSELRKYETQKTRLSYLNSKILKLRRIPSHFCSHTISHVRRLFSEHEPNGIGFEVYILGICSSCKAQYTYRK